MEGRLVETERVEAVRGEGVQPPHPAFLLRLSLRGVDSPLENSERKVAEAATAIKMFGDTRRIFIHNVVHMFRYSRT